MREAKIKSQATGEARKTRVHVVMPYFLERDKDTEDRCLRTYPHILQDSANKV